MFYGLDWIANGAADGAVDRAALRGRSAPILCSAVIFGGHQLGAASRAFGAGLSRTALATYLPAFFIAARYVWWLR